MNTEMSPQEVVDLTRRDFLATGTTGLGTLALASLLQKDGLLAPSANAAPRTDPLAPKRTHFPPKAKNCILIYFELHDEKPTLKEPYTWSTTDLRESNLLIIELTSGNRENAAKLIKQMKATNL